MSGGSSDRLDEARWQAVPRLFASYSVAFFLAVMAAGVSERGTLIAGLAVIGVGAVLALSAAGLAALASRDAR